MASRLPYFIILVAFLYKNVESVRVCRTFPDYYNTNSQNCYDNSDPDLNATQILQKWGCTAEEYNIYTDDGYKLLVIRAYKNIKSPTPIVFAHGAVMNARSLLVSSNISLAYQILESGHQIFFVSSRGSSYSQGHITLSSDDLRYWNFSVHEMAKYDTPKILDLVANVTSGAKSIWLGYSMGTISGVAYATLFPDEAAAKLLGIVTIGTACFLKDIPSILRVAAATYPLFTPFTTVLWKGKFLPRTQLLPLLQFMSKGPLQYFLIYITLSIIAGFNLRAVPAEYFPIVALNALDDIGQTAFIHILQLMNSGNFQQFDYGGVGNLRQYGTPQPPHYDVSKIKVRVAQFLGSGDLLTTVKNGQRLDSLLNSNVRCGVTVVDDPRFNHLNFVDHKDLPKLVAEPLLKKFKALEANVC